MLLHIIPHWAGRNKKGQKRLILFFYVSSSEWNLYEFIDSFIRLHDLPKGIIKLKNIRSGISDFLFSGKGNHDNKFEKIKEIINSYPNLSFVLLGDDSQQDAYIYEHIVKFFSHNLAAVYIRQTGRKPKGRIENVMKNIESMGVATCYFKDSSVAIRHSEKFGLI